MSESSYMLESPQVKKIQNQISSIRDLVTTSRTQYGHFEEVVDTQEQQQVLRKIGQAGQRSEGIFLEATEIETLVKFINSLDTKLHDPQANRSMSSYQDKFMQTMRQIGIDVGNGSNYDGTRLGSHR